MITAFEELTVWQFSRKLGTDIYKITSNKQYFDDFSLARQMQRASVSIMSNIAEGFERGHKKEFLHFLYISKGSCAELRAQLYLARDLSFISDTDFNSTMGKATEISKMLGGLIKSIKAKLK